MKCGAPHPSGSTCVDRDPNHQEHVGFLDGERIYWPNESYEPPAPKKSTGKIVKAVKTVDDLKVLAGLIPSEPKRRVFVQEQEATRIATEEAIARVEEAASEEWKRHAYIAVRKVAEANDEFTADEVWLEFERQELPATHEPAALGPIFLRAAREGMIENTGRRRKRSIYAHRHRELTIWRSLVKG